MAKHVDAYNTDPDWVEICILFNATTNFVNNDYAVIVFVEYANNATMVQGDGGIACVVEYDTNIANSNIHTCNTGAATSTDSF